MYGRFAGPKKSWPQERGDRIIGVPYSCSVGRVGGNPGNEVGRKAGF